jgi:hypothetical protein
MPSPLKETEIESLYVDMDDVRGQQHPVRRLAVSIKLASADQFTCQLLAGHLGSGKSTELACLGKVLESEEKCFVIRFSAHESLNRIDVDVTDLLLALARVLCEQVKNRLGVTLAVSSLESVFSGVKQVLKSELHFTKAQIKLKFLELSAELNDHPDFRRIVRQQAAPVMRQLLEALNNLFDQTRSEINRKNRTRLVFLVDDLDKLSPSPWPNDGKTPHERIFIDGVQELTSLRCHVVYTVPLDLAYAQNDLSALYGREMPILPMVRVRSRHPEEPPDDAAKRGRQLFRDLVCKRLGLVGLTEEQVFADGILDRLILFSGGQPHELMILIGNAVLVDCLPISEVAARRVEGEARRRHAMKLLEEHKALLEEVRSHGALTRTDENERYRRDLLASRSVLLYMNSEEWYGLNPALEDPYGEPSQPERAPATS